MDPVLKKAEVGHHLALIEAQFSYLEKSGRVADSFPWEKKTFWILTLALVANLNSHYLSASTLNVYSEPAPAILLTVLSSELVHVAKATAGHLAGVWGLFASLGVPASCPKAGIGFLGEALTWTGICSPGERSTGQEIPYTLVLGSQTQFQTELEDNKERL